MPIKRIPSGFLYRSLRETRRLRNALNLLKSDIEMLKSPSTLSEDLNEFEREIFSDDDCCPRKNPDCLWALIDEHAGYQDYFVKNRDILRPFIPPLLMVEYLEAVRRFDSAVHEIDSDYPVLRYFDV